MDLNEIRRAGRLERSLEDLFKDVKGCSDKARLREIRLFLRTDFGVYRRIIERYKLQDRKYREIRREYNSALSYIHQNL